MNRTKTHIPETFLPIFIIIIFLLAIPGMVFVQTPAPEKGTLMQEGRFDHAAYHALLQRYVDDAGFVDYTRWKRQDERTLDAYLEAVGATDPALLRDRSETLAFWINVYNALTIKAILYHYPTKSIRDHVSILGYNIWKDYKLSIHGNDYSLDHIEHEILRKMKEPRIHFAIVCASVGCPLLRNETYTSDRLEAQLMENTRIFFSDPDKFRIDREKRIVYLSSILDWFKEDFGGNQRERLGFISQYAPQTARPFLREENLKVRYLDYDWNLNDQARRGAQD